MKINYNKFGENLTITSEYLGSKKANWGTKDMPENWNNHKVTIRNNLTEIEETFDFWGSIVNPEIRSESDLKHAVYCFISDAHSGTMTFNEFCGEFGYSNDSIKSSNIHKACIESLDKYYNLFGNNKYSDNLMYKLLDDLQE